MLWKNVDFENRIITIDASVMKGRKIHWSRCRPVVELLTTLSFHHQTSIRVCFAGRNDKKKPICENAVLLGDQNKSAMRVRKAVTDSGMNSSTIMNEHEWPG